VSLVGCTESSLKSGNKLVCRVGMLRLAVFRRPGLTVGRADQHSREQAVKTELKDQNSSILPRVRHCSRYGFGWSPFGVGD
jgi:hypothetical protein